MELALRLLFSALADYLATIEATPQATLKGGNGDDGPD